MLSLAFTRRNYNWSPSRRKHWLIFSMAKMYNMGETIVLNYWHHSHSAQSFWSIHSQGFLREHCNALCNRRFVSTDSASAKLIHFVHLFCKIIVVGFCARSVSFMWNFTVKYVERLAHAHYYPCNRYQAFTFCASVCLYVSLRTWKIRPGDEARYYPSIIRF